MRSHLYTTRANRSVRIAGKFPSLKLGRSLPWRSQLERDLFYLLEFDRDVIAYSERAPAVTYRIDGERRSHTADLIVERTGGRHHLFDVRRLEQIAEPSAERLFRYLVAACLDEGYEYTIATEREIRRQPRLDNVRLLARYSRVQLRPQHEVLCHELLGRASSLRVEDLFIACERAGYGREHGYALLYHGAVGFDLDTRLDAHVNIYAPTCAPPGKMVLIDA